MATSLITCSEVREGGEGREGREKKENRRELARNQIWHSAKDRLVPRAGVSNSGLDTGAKEFCLAHLPLIKTEFGGEKREPSYTVCGNVNWCSHYGEQYGGSLKN